MTQPKILKTLWKKFKWNFLFLFLLIFLVNYFLFLIPFNFRQNLPFNKEKRGWFYYLFGKYSVIQETHGARIHVNWNKLLLILFLLYFLFTITVQSILNYLQASYQRRASVFLTKKLLNFASKHQDLMIKKPAEKIKIVNHYIPLFSQQFFAIPVKIFAIFINLCFNLFWLYFLLKSNKLFALAPFIFAFILINLIWLILFKVLTIKNEQFRKKKALDCQQLEKNSLALFFQNLDDINKATDLQKMHRSLDKNSQQLSALHFTWLFLDLPYLIIPGLQLLFLLLVYKLFFGGQGNLGWDLYFVAFSIRSIFFSVRKTFNLLPTISSWLENYQQVKKFFD